MRRDIARHRAARDGPISRSNAAAFLLSDLAGGISAEIVYVDGGFSQVAMVDPSA